MTIQTLQKVPVGFGFLAAALLGIASSQPAQAASFSCGTLTGPSGTALVNKVVNTRGCEYTDNNNDNVGGALADLDVNTDGLFGGGWRFYGKDSDTLDFSPFGPSDGQIRGTWDITSVLDTLNKSLAELEVLLVFKGGNNSAPTNGGYVGYLLDGDRGDWESPFENPNNGNLKEVSHISLYYRDQEPSAPVAVPEPATALGVILGAGWMVTKRRRA